MAVTTSSVYERQAATRTAAEARELAEAQLAEQLAAESAGRTVLSKTVETVLSEGSVKLLCTVVCEENIATVREFEGIPNEVGGK